MESEKYYVNGIPHGNFTFYKKQAGKIKQVLKYKKGLRISNADEN